ARRSLRRWGARWRGRSGAGVASLPPPPPAPAARPVPERGAPAGPPIFFNVSFGDAEHGAVQVFRRGNPPNRPPPIYLTADGGRTWKRLTNPTNDIFAVAFVGRQRMLAEELGRALPRLLVSDNGGGHQAQPARAPRRP